MPSYDRLPLIALKTVLFPRMTLPLYVPADGGALSMLRGPQRSRPIGAVLSFEGADGAAANRYPETRAVGTLARIECSEETDDGRFLVVLRGESRIEIDEVFGDGPCRTGCVRPAWDAPDDPLVIQPVFDQVCHLFREYARESMRATGRQTVSVQLPGDPALLSYAIGALLPVDVEEKQALLQIASAGDRLRRERELLQAECLRLKQCNETDCEVDDACGVPIEGLRPQTVPTIRTGIVRIDSSYTRGRISRN